MIRSGVGEEPGAGFMVLCRMDRLKGCHKSGARARGVVLDDRSGYPPGGAPERLAGSATESGLHAAMARPGHDLYSARTWTHGHSRGEVFACLSGVFNPFGSALVKGGPAPPSCLG